MRSGQERGFLRLLPSTHRVTRLIVVVLASASLAIFGRAGDAAASHVSCGDTITADTTLDSDLMDCPGDGIVIGADGITLDLGGHTIDGADPNQTNHGIFGYPRSGVTITNGSVYEFWTGIELVGGSGNTVRDVTAGCGRTKCDAVETWGMYLGGTAVTGSTIVNNDDPDGYSRGIQAGNSRIEGNRFEHNDHAVDVSQSVVRGNSLTDSGNIHVTYGRGNLIEDNTIHGSGISVYDGSANTIRANRIHGAYVGVGVCCQDAAANIVEANEVVDSRYGVYLTETYRNRITDNLIRRSGTGITIDYGSAENVITRNQVVRSENEGILLTSNIYRTTYNNQVLGNTVRLSGADGIAIDSETTGTVVEQNRSSRNRDDGIDVDNAEATLTRNRADRNGDLGIEAVDGVTDGGGNRARGNRNRLQCTGVSCR
jgi:parallel beta-helix repeat protein